MLPFHPMLPLRANSFQRVSKLAASTSLLSPFLRPIPITFLPPPFHQDSASHHHQQLPHCWSQRYFRAFILLALSSPSLWKHYLHSASQTPISFSLGLASVSLTAILNMVHSFLLSCPLNTGMPQSSVLGPPLHLPPPCHLMETQSSKHHFYTDYPNFLLSAWTCTLNSTHISSYLLNNHLYTC